MARPLRTQQLRRLHSERARWDVSSLAGWLADPSDPLELRALIEREWFDAAALAPIDPLMQDMSARVAAGFFDRTRDERSVGWLAREAGRVVGEALAREPRDWRAIPTEPTGFERSVAACFGVEDRAALRIIAHYHSLPLEDRRAVHILLPHRRLGASTPHAGHSRSKRRAVADARRGLVLIRHLVATARFQRP